MTLSQRLSAAFALLLLACCAAAGWLQMRAATHDEQVVVQRLSRGLAAHIAGNAALMQGGALDADAVRRLFDALMTVNPSVEVYLLDAQGRIRSHAAPPGRVRVQQVDLAPLRRLLAGEPLPIVGDDPRGGPRKVFSAAPLMQGEVPMGYVYVVLQGESHAALAADVGASTAWQRALGSLALVAALGLVAGLLAFRWITRRLRLFTADVARLGGEGVERWTPTAADAAERPGTRDEIVLLQQAFADLARRVSAQWRELAGQDQQRRELVANLSHDLRTPLTSLHGYLETLALKDATLEPAERRRYLEIALAQSRKVGQLAQSLFELARLEYGAIQPEAERFSLADLVQDVFQKFELAAEARQLRLSADVAPDLPAVEADLGMIERVLTNLLDNALRHTPPGGEVRVELRRDGSRVAVQVADTGPGIAAELKGGLFTRPSVLSRGARPPAVANGSGGGGLGLVIVQRILRLHGADIRLVEQPGRGAVFAFGLAASEGPAAPPA